MGIRGSGPGPNGEFFAYWPSLGFMHQTSDNTAREHPLAVAIEALEMDVVEASATGDSPAVQRLAPMISKLRKEYFAELRERNVLLHVDEVIAEDRLVAQDCAEIAWELLPDEQANELVRRITEKRREREEKLHADIENV